VCVCVIDPGLKPSAQLPGSLHPLPHSQRGEKEEANGVGHRAHRPKNTRASVVQIGSSRFTSTNSTVNEWSSSAEEDNSPLPMHGRPMGRDLLEGRVVGHVRTLAPAHPHAHMSLLQHPRQDEDKDEEGARRTKRG